MRPCFVRRLLPQAPMHNTYWAYSIFPYEEGDVIKLIGQTGDTIVFKFASKNEYYTYEESEYKCGWHEWCCVFTDSTEGRLDFNGETEVQSRTGEMPGKGYM